MKSPHEVRDQVQQRLTRSWSQVVTGAVWAPRFPLGTSSLTGARLADQWGQVQRDALEWQRWLTTAGPGIRLEWRRATVHGTEQPLPASMVVETVDAAAALLGPEWAARLDRNRRRARRLAELFPLLDNAAGLLRSTDAWSEIDFDLACEAARWFASNPSSGRTAREVPVLGMGTKWLDKRAGVVRRLSGLTDLGLVAGRPPRVHLTYLDPDHLAGGRRHDVATAGDVDSLAYRPSVVVISENRDTAQRFPDVPGGIAVEGDGNGPGAVPALPWVREAAHLFYWGDMDAKGLEILHDFRAAGVPALSLFMDLVSYEQWERFGVDHDHDGRTLGPRPPRRDGVPELECGERELYLALCSPEWARHRRIEQERIPLEDAAAAISAAMLSSTP